MPHSTNQSNVIENINQYLKWHNLPVRFGTGGVCNGLSTVHAQYVLQGREREFFELLRYVAGDKGILDANDSVKEKVNNFVWKVVASHMTSGHDKELNQLNSFKTLSINNKPLKSVFDLPLVTSDKNWENILESLNLKEDEVMLVRSINHAISITRKGNQYHVYDPNYEEGVKSFSSEQEVIKELHERVFHYNKGNMGLTLSIITTGDKEPRQDLPKPVDIYDQYLNKENVNSLATITVEHPLGGPWDLTKKTIDLASECGDENLINKLIELHQFDFNNMPIEQASQAVQYNNVRAAELLVNDMIRILSKQDPVAQDEFSDIPAEELPAEFLKQFEEIPDAPEGDEIKEAEVQNPKVVMPPSEKKIKDLLYPLILKAASYGRKEVFDTLCEMWNKNAGDFDKEDLKNFILLAAKGGNSVLLQELIDKYYESNMTLYDKDIQGKVDGIIHELISKGSPDSAVCIELLLNTLSKEGKSIDDRQLAAYISRAFEGNKPHMIERFIKGISDEKRLEFLIRAIKKDQPHMVELFIKDLPKELLNTISLSLPAIEKMNVATLKILEKNGMKFSEMEKAIIAKKSHQPVGFLLSIGVALAKFTDFCKEVLFKNESVTYDKNKFQAFKSQLNSIKTQNSLANNEPVEAQQNDQVAVYRP
ncbi:YopT-type cysteine protease domain-containing protein [Legionella pneumophila serogroup 1]